MLNLINAERSAFNVQLDNYLCIESTENTLCNVTYEELLMIEELSAHFHSEPLVIECNKKTQDIVNFLINIDKLTLISKQHLGSYCYYTVRKSSGTLDLN